jgi:enolase
MLKAVANINGDRDLLLGKMQSTKSPRLAMIALDGTENKSHAGLLNLILAVSLAAAKRLRGQRRALYAHIADLNGRCLFDASANGEHQRRRTCR